MNVSLIARLRLSVASRLGRHPALYLPVARRQYRKALQGLGPGANRDAVPPVVGPGTEIVIEGYPRSANSFAVAAFRQAQGRPVNIAHHRHAAAQVLGGIRMGVPVLVLIRKPEEAVPSLAARHRFGVGGALAYYTRFYGPLLRHRDRVEWARFEEVTTDFGAVVQRINARYGTSFAPFEHTEDNVRRCAEEIAAHDRATLGADADLMGALPNAARAPVKERLRAEYCSPRLARPRARAESLYRDLAPEGRGSAPRS